MAPSIMTVNCSRAMTERGKYERTPETRAKNAESLRGRKQPDEAIAKRTATRKAKGTLVTHGHGSAKEGRTRTYNSWDNMVQRCTNPNRPEYEFYGGRGITVCEHWRDFANFL